MQKLFIILSVLIICSCSEEIKTKQSGIEDIATRSKTWHLKDTLRSTSNWTSDSVRQVKLDLKNRKNVKLLANSDAPVFLFLGDRLVKKSKAGVLEYFFNKSNEQQAFLSLDRKVQMLSYGVFSTKNSQLDSTAVSLNIEERSSLWVSNNLLLVLFIVASILMLIIKLNFDKRYSDILRVSKIFTTRFNEGDQSRVRVMDQDNLVFAGFYVFITAGLIYFLNVESNLLFFSNQQSGIVEFLFILFIVSVGLLLKILLVAFASNLFGSGKISAFYVREMLNINLFFIILLFFSSIFIYLNGSSIPAFWVSVATYSFFIGYGLRFILLYFKILKLSSFTNLYLFSYFCTTEIFPFLIGLKYFMR